MALELKSKNEKKKEENFKEARRKRKTTTKAPGKLSKERGGDNYLRQGTARPESRQQV